MPEGDTIFRAAATLERAIGGQMVTRFESVYPHLTRVDADRPIAGRTVLSVAARGKHILMTFSGDLILRTHMRMNGSWHLYRLGERWQRPARDMRVLLETASFVAVGFNVPVAEFLSSHDLSRHPELGRLGPDLLDPAFDRGGAIGRLRAHGADTLDVALLNQRIVAGVGNVLKSETLFVAGLNPFRRVATLTDEEVERVVDVGRDLLAASVLPRRATLSPAIGRRTTRSLDPDVKLWVYRRHGHPCRRCGTAIRSARSGVDARSTYWCPRCQPEHPILQTPR
jgi:endonuclease-8